MITGFNHVGIAVADLDETIRIFQELFGAEVIIREKIEEAGQESAIISIGTGQIELMAPVGHGGVVGKYLATHGPGLHHISLRADQFDEDTTVLEEKGVKIFGKTQVFGKKVCFAHPKSTGGILYEILEPYTPEELKSMQRGEE